MPVNAPKPTNHPHEPINTEPGSGGAAPLRGSTVDYVQQRLREGVIQGRYAPGQRLIEADLTQEFGVSRGPLREAFRRLSAEGLLEIVPHRGAIVRRLSLREMVELFQIRAALEALAARLAAGAIADPEVRARFEREASTVLADHPRFPGLDYIAENGRFHEAIITASGNRELLHMTRHFQLPSILYQLAGMLTRENIEASVAEHRGIAEAILSGNAELAEARIKAHIERAIGIAVSMPANLFRS